MAKDPPNRIAELRKSRNLSQAQLAEAIGAHLITVSKLERGKLRATFEWMSRISDALGVHISELMPEVLSTDIDVFANAVLSDNGGVNHLKRDEFLHFKVAIDSIYNNPLSISSWIVVDTHQLYPAWHRGDLMLLKNIWHADEYHLGLGRLCHVIVEDPLEILLGRLERGSSPELFDLYIPGGVPKRDLKIQQLSIIAAGVFRPGPPEGLSRQELADWLKDI